MKTLLAVSILIFAQLALPASIIVKRGISESDQKNAVDAANKFRKEHAKKENIANMNELTYDVDMEKLAEVVNECKRPTKHPIFWFSDFDSLIWMNTNAFYKTIACTKAPHACELPLSDNKWGTMNAGNYFCILGPNINDIKDETVITGEPGSKCPEETVSKDGLCGINGGYFVNFNLVFVFLSIFYSFM